MENKAKGRHYRCFRQQLFQKLLFRPIYLETRDTSSALDSLEASVRHSIAFIPLPDKFSYTSQLFNRLAFHREALSKNYTCTEAEKILHFLEASIYDSIRDAERFHNLQAQLRAYCKRKYSERC